MKHLTVTFGVLSLLLLVVIGCLLNIDSQQNFRQDSTNYFKQNNLSLKISNHVDFRSDEVNPTSNLVLEFERKEAVNGTIEEKYYSIMMLGKKKKTSRISALRQRSGEFSFRLISTLDTNAYWFWNVFFQCD